MSRKAPIALIEQTVMILIFALAAALCLRVFAWSDLRSVRNDARDQAVLIAQTAAETLKAEGGDMAHALTEACEEMGGSCAQGLWYICYDENWNQVPDNQPCVYRLAAQGEPAPVDGMWQARVWVDVEEEISVGGTYNGPLFELTVAWQEGA